MAVSRMADARPQPDRPAPTDRAGFSGRRVLVCGTGVAGRSAIAALTAVGAAVQVSGAGSAPADLPAGVEFLGDVTEPPSGIDIVAPSPGLPPSHRLLISAQARGLPILGELELAWRLRGPAPARWLLVTGTNGKTTTVRMLASILASAGLSSLAVGNVGTPIIDAVLRDGDYDVLAVEASSFQLTFARSLLPRAGVVLNLAEDHLDWHGSMADYARQKARVWNGEVAVANADDPAVMALLSVDTGRPIAPETVTFTLASPKPGQFGVINATLVDATGPDVEDLLPVADIRPAGPHNVANALAAAALASSVGCSSAAIAAGLRSFVPDPHRNQFVSAVAEVQYVDDSKATNPHAAEASLTSYPRVVWVVGGQLKGADIAPLVASVRSRLVGAVVLGVDGDLVAAALQRHAADLPVIRIDRTDDGVMDDVVRSAQSLAAPGDVVLLAPAAASKDMFTGYDARGRAFADAVRALAAGSQA